MITVDMTKAKDIAKDILRLERKPILETLDVRYIRSIESGNTELQSAISEQKQTLRDITSHETIIDSQNPTQLKTALLDLVTQIKSVE